VRSKIYNIYTERLIPSWKATDVIPEILVISANPPPISGSDITQIPFWCANTVDKDGGIIDETVVVGTIFDDQT